MTIDLDFIKNAVLGGVSVGAIFYAWQLKKQPTPGSPEKKSATFDDGYNFPNDTSLSTISVVWTDKRQKLAEISKIWRTPEEKIKVSYPRPLFRHTGLQNFWDEHIESKRYFDLHRLRTITEILNRLDVEGDCPSVVNRHDRESERNLDAISYSILEKLPLWQHTVNVANLYINQMSHNVMIPDAIIIALGHDMGKLPSIYGSYYATGDHPVLGRLLLEQLPHFKEIQNKEEILKIIEEHHLPASKDPLAIALRNCDTAARKSELSTIVEKDMTAVKQKRANHSQIVADALAVNASPEQLGRVEQINAVNANKQRHQGKRTASTAPDWFDETKFRIAMRSRINRIKSGNWESVSTTDGIVWFKYPSIIDAIRESSDNNSEFSALGVDKEAQGHMILSILKSCGIDPTEEGTLQHGCVVWDLMGKGYSGTKCRFETIKGMAKNPIYLTPIKASWFLTTPSILEQEKTPDIKRMVTRVEIERTEP